MMADTTVLLPQLITNDVDEGRISPADFQSSLEQSNILGFHSNDLVSNDVVVSDDSEDEQLVLDPEHPLMVRFQNALRDHLTKRQEELELDLSELRSKLESRKKEREEIGILLYSEQQYLAQCQARLDTLNDTFQSTTGERLMREHEMTDVRKLYKQIFKNVDDCSNQANQLHKGLDDLNLKIFYLLASHDDVRSDVKVMRRVASKTRDDINKSEREKQKQDYYVDLLTDIIDQKKTEIEMSKAQFIVQHEEAIKYRNFLNEAETELQVLMTDLAQVEHNWKGTLLGVNRMDVAFSKLLDEFREEEQNMIRVDREFEAVKKSILKEEEKHEKLSYILNRAGNNILTSKKAMGKVEKMMEDLKLSFTQKMKVLANVEESLANTLALKAQKTTELMLLQREYEQSVHARNEAREQLMNVYQTHSSYTKAAAYSKKTAEEHSARIRDLEAAIACDESSLAIDDQELINTERKIVIGQELLETLKKEIEEKNNLINEYETSFDRNHVSIEQKQNYMDECNKRIGRLLEKQDGNEMSPLENVALNLTKSLKKESDKILDDQTIWVEKQHEYLNLLEERQSVEHLIKKCSQDIYILTGNKNRYDNKTKMELAEKKHYVDEVKWLRGEMERLALLVFDKRELKNQLETSSYLSESEFVRELKDHEMNFLNLQRKLEDTNDEKETLLCQIVDIEKQIGFWERKIQLGVEMKEMVNPRSNQTADTSLMKSEIHRMTVRYQALMREQERLIRRMEEVVARRESIVSYKKSVDKREPDRLTKSKCYKRIQTVKAEIEKYKKEIASLDEERKNLQKKADEFGLKLDERKALVIQKKAGNCEAEENINRMLIEKQKNLHELVRLQKRSILYSNIKAGKYKFLCMDISTIEENMAKEREKMKKILSVVNHLKRDFPDNSAVLEKIVCCFGHVYE